MAAKTFGTAHLFGVDGTITNATVMSFSTDENHGISDTTKDESGIVIERRYDDETTTASITLRFQAAYTEPTIGTQLTYDSVKYIIETKGKAQEQEGFQQITLGLITSEGITLA